MLKKTITYNDYNGVSRTEDFYFNLSKAEIMEMEMSTAGGMEQMINKIIAAQEIPAILKVFNDMILKSYGEKSADGKRFIKNKELTDEFTQTEAYSNLYMELSTDANAAAAFVNGIIPVDVSKQVMQEAAVQATSTTITPIA